MKNMKQILIAAFFVVLVAGCKSSTTAPASTTTTSGGSGIGPNGGTVTSTDGKVSLVIPPGALSSTQTIAITPKTDSNTCPQAIGSGYNLTPNGLTFSTPAQFTLSYDTTIRGANAEFIGVASQEDTGGWYGWTGGSVDTIHHTVTVPITHFSRETGYLGFEIAPSTDVVFTGSSTPFGVYQVGPPANSPAGTQVALTNPFAVAGAIWKLNGGSGSLSAGVGLSTDYMAPATMPSPNQVTITATITTNGQKFVVPAFINVIAQNWTLTGVDSIVYSCGVDGTGLLTYTVVSGGYCDVQISPGGNGATAFGWFPSGTNVVNQSVCPYSTNLVANYTFSTGNGMSLSSVNSGFYLPSTNGIYLLCSEQSCDLPGYTVNYNGSGIPPMVVALSPGRAFNGELQFTNLSSTNTWLDDQHGGALLDHITWTLTAQ